MHHLVIEGWSVRNSVLHRRDSRAKIVATLLLLIAIATAQARYGIVLAAYLAVLCVSTLFAGLPLLGLLIRAAAVLPFSFTFAILTAISGDYARGLMLVGKSYVSACAALLLVSTTPFPVLLRGFESLKAPRYLLTVMQFLHRYLFVVTEEAQHMRAAAACRGGLRKAGFGGAAGVLGVLFARSYTRAQSVHHAMLSRGYYGRFPVLNPSLFRAVDVLFLSGAVVLILAVRISVQ